MFNAHSTEVTFVMLKLNSSYHDCQFDSLTENARYSVSEEGGQKLPV